MTNMKTAIVHHNLYKEHDTGFGHPECPERYSVVINALKNDSSLWQSIIEIEADPAPHGDVGACHDPQQIKRVEKVVREGTMFLDADTVVSMKSLDAALLAAGGACDAVDAVMSGKVKNAFLPARPPGHHASRNRAMGFCLFNNVAVAARYAQQKYKEIETVAIIDWDVHHGNGTQGIFYDDPTVFFFSMHQYPWYPGTGTRGETGFGRGRGFTLNVPVKAATKAKEQVRMFETALEEISAKINPDMIFISAGFDAHESDPLGQLKLEDEDYISMTRTLKQWADESCNGRIVSCLEGGYNLSTLGQTVNAHVRTLAE